MKLIYLVFAMLLSLQSLRAQQDLPDSAFNIQDGVMIPVGHGNSIWSTIAIKRGNTKPLPVILFYTTYYQGPSDALFAKMSADKDYVGIVAYSRGIHTNLNNYFPYEHDAHDTYEVIDWISKQSWCSGSIGMFGGSYTGFVQWVSTKHLHPALKTIVPQVAVMPGFDAPMENNIPQSFALSWANDILNDKPLPRNLNDYWYRRGSSYRALDSLAGMVNPIFQKWLQHPDYDKYWQALSPTPEEYANLNIPILCTTGYYDGSQISALEYAKRYYQYNSHPNLYFVVGPYDHYGGQRAANPNLMGYQIDSVANISMRDLAFQWLDYILKGKEKPSLLQDKINYEVMGANVWKHVSSFDKMSNDSLRFYLSSEHNGNYYALTETRSNTVTWLNQEANFQDRTTQNNYFTSTIINDSLDASNGLVFVTQPFKESSSINGSFSGALSFSINKKDVDISIAFYEQMPNGKYFYLTRYLGRASYAKNNSKRELLKPNSITTIPVANTRLISRQFSAGSRLVIILNVNKHPYEEINYGSGKNVHDETIEDAGEPMQIKWYSDSFITVHVTNGK